VRLIHLSPQEGVDGREGATDCRNASQRDFNVSSRRDRDKASVAGIQLMVRGLLARMISYAFPSLRGRRVFRVDHVRSGGLHWINGFHSSPCAAIDSHTTDFLKGSPLGRLPPLAWRPPEPLRRVTSARGTGPRSAAGLRPPIPPQRQRIR
jgi:hypothetical protein